MTICDIQDSTFLLIPEFRFLTLSWVAWLLFQSLRGTPWTGVGLWEMSQCMWSLAEDDPKVPRKIDESPSFNFLVEAIEPMTNWVNSTFKQQPAAHSLASSAIKLGPPALPGDHARTGYWALWGSVLAKLTCFYVHCCALKGWHRFDWNRK